MDAETTPTRDVPEMPTAPALPQTLPPVLSVASYGASGDPARDATAAFESALARAGQLAARPHTAGGPPTALVRVPGGVHTVSRPLFVPSGVDVAGDGWSTRLEMAGLARFPALVYGVADPQTVEADRPELFGLLDASAAARPNLRRGWSTAGGRTLQGQFFSGNLGPWADGARTYWEGAQAFTLDVALGRPAAGWPPSVPLLGCGRSCVVDDPQPWCLWTSPRPGWLVLSLRTGDGPVGIAVEAPSGPVVRLSVQVDLSAGSAAAWANGRRVAALFDALRPGQRLAANTTWPMLVGRQGYQQGTTTDPPTPLVLAGLHLATAPRYQLGPIGSPQLRADGRPADDAYRYFDRSDPATVGFLPFDDPAGRRWLRWTPADGLDELVLVLGPGQRGAKPARLADLQVWSRGPAVLLGAVLDWRADNLRLQSETGAALGSVPIVMAYPITLRGCTLSGGDAAISLSSSLVALRDCKVEGQGRDGIRLRGASLDASNLFAAFMPPNARTFLNVIAGHEGDVVIRLDRAILDYEDRGPADALVVVEPEPQHPTTVRILDLSGALTGPDYASPRPPVRLVDAQPGARARLILDGLATGPRPADVGGGRGWQIAGPTPAGPTPPAP